MSFEFRLSPDEAVRQANKVMYSNAEAVYVSVGVDDLNLYKIIDTYTIIDCECVEPLFLVIFEKNCRNSFKLKSLILAQIER